MIFCDTSAVAKLYVVEQGSAAVRAIVESEDRVLASALARVELMAVFHRQLREKKWTSDLFAAAVRQFQRDEAHGFWSWLPVESAIIEMAAKTFTTLPGNVFLRAADCIHIVTAMHHGLADIHTYDIHQAAAARALGLNPLAPGIPP